MNGGILIKKLLAFTLAEIIVVITLIGTVAAITIPSAMKNTSETTNRLKIKKAINTYNNALEQYYISDFDASTYKGQTSAISTARSKALADEDYTGMTTTEKSARRKEIIADYTSQTKTLKKEYVNMFIEHFKINKSEESGDAIYYRMNDGLWWYFGTDPSMLSVIVAFDIKNPQTNKPYTLSELQDIAMQDDNRAFYFVAYKPDYAITPIANDFTGVSYSNLTGGKEARQKYMINLVENSASSSTATATSNNVSSTYKITKLYSYINNKSFSNQVSNFCTSYNCCSTKKGLCVKTDAWDNNNLRKQIYLYRDGKQVYTAYGYNPANGSFYWEIYHTENGGSCMEYRGSYTEGDCSSKVPSFQ